MLSKKKWMTGVLIYIILAVIWHAKFICYLMHNFCGIIVYTIICAKIKYASEI